MRCPYCFKDAQLVGGDVIYPHRPDLAGKKFWLCRPCDAYVGCHANSPRHAPLGRLANKELREWKMRVHAAFDPLWKDGRMSRNQAYRFLADGINVAQKKCHVGMFDVETCKKAVDFVNGIDFDVAFVEEAQEISDDDYKKITQSIERRKQ